MLCASAHRYLHGSNCKHEGPEGGWWMCGLRGGPGNGGDKHQGTLARAHTAGTAWDWHLQAVTLHRPSAVGTQPGKAAWTPMMRHWQANVGDAQGGFKHSAQRFLMKSQHPGAL